MNSDVKTCYSDSVLSLRQTLAAPHYCMQSVKSPNTTAKVDHALVSFSLWLLPYIRPEHSGSEQWSVLLNFLVFRFQAVLLFFAYIFLSAYWLYGVVGFMLVDVYMYVLVTLAGTKYWTPTSKRRKDLF